MRSAEEVRAVFGREASPKKKEQQSPERTGGLRWHPQQASAAAHVLTPGSRTLDTRHRCVGRRTTSLVIVAASRWRAGACSMTMQRASSGAAEAVLSAGEGARGADCVVCPRPPVREKGKLRENAAGEKRRALPWRDDSRQATMSSGLKRSRPDADDDLVDLFIPGLGKITVSRKLASSIAVVDPKTGEPVAGASSDDYQSGGWTSVGDDDRFAAVPRGPRLACSSSARILLPALTAPQCCAEDADTRRGWTQNCTSTPCGGESSRRWPRPHFDCSFMQLSLAPQNVALPSRLCQHLAQIGGPVPKGLGARLLALR